MNAFLHILLTLIYLSLFIFCYRSLYESSFWGTSWLLFLLLALVFDQSVLSLGMFIGQSQTLEVLSQIRYLLHILLTPTMVFIAYDFLRRSRVQWAEQMSAKLIFNAYTFILTVIGVFTEYLWVSYEPVQIAGVTKYVASNHYVSLPILLALIPLSVAAIGMWKAFRWPILFMGLGVSLVLYFACILFQSYTLSSVGTFVLIIFLVFTEYRLKQDDYQLQLKEPSIHG